MIFFLIPDSILNPQCSAGSNRIVNFGLNLVVVHGIVFAVVVCLCYCCCGGWWVAAVSWLVVEPDGTVRASPPTLQLLHLPPTQLNSNLPAATLPQSKCDRCGYDSTYSTVLRNHMKNIQLADPSTSPPTLCTLIYHNQNVNTTQLNRRFWETIWRKDPGGWTVQAMPPTF